ncbi:MAG: ribosome maturation factor RimM [Lachnospiraceae bacterium]
MKIQVGKIVKGRGLKEVKLASLIDNTEILKFPLSLSQRATHRSGFGKNGRKFVYVRFSTVTDRNAAEGLRGLGVIADKEQLPLEEGRFFIDELIGCSVRLNDGTFVGVLDEILQNGSADVYVAVKDDKKILFPFLKDLTIRIDVDAKEILLDKKRFSEVSVDEN